MCVVETGDEHEVVVDPKGTVTSFTVVDPSQYPGSTEKAPYVVASILIDGASMSIGQQRVAEIAPEDARTGMRIEAVWSGDDPSISGGTMGGALSHWAPNGEPDVSPEELAGQM
jgi:uncharacterized OB-fold protein